MTANERDSIAQLVRALGEAGGALCATPQEIEQLRDFFGRQVLRADVDSYILEKFQQHVEIDGHWPEDTVPEEYLASLRETVLDSRGAIYLTADSPDGEWTIYFVGRVRRPWRGPAGSNCIVVIFNAERPLLVTGFQPRRDEANVERQGGFWLHER
jgi:hypothetical protein